ncbi:hypothetical protein GCM10011360_09720 [Primorskyibacter flagellatus]|uniref:DUF1330 domain-containing protein n=1 Tax=Primorskyibacter flagellatus TaxID=1387277 RepID=A0A917ECA9_9RHOB|nr:DUF1330 domain-containing protein [Primorskyibacter flagellatus]GGE23243.1 hypothetical protein GCM10011360_09720 [Primorskyibacter flagellatus]
MHTGFTKEEFEAFKAIGRDGPIHMLNLVRVREMADYPDGRRATGAEAYAAYGRDSAPVLERVGGRIVWRGSMEFMLIGPRDEQWDYCFIAEYPSQQAFIDMIYDAEYRRAMVHRQAGCSDSRLIRMMPQDAGANFAE